MNLKPILFLGIAGGIVAAVRKRGAPEQVQQYASQAADKASDLADRAKEAAPESVAQAVDSVKDKVGQGGNGDQAGQDSSPSDEAPRYAAPAEAGAQPPVSSGGPPSDATQVRTTVDEAEDLVTKAHDLPAGTVMPDTSADDPSVQEAEAAAAADAAQIGGQTTESEIPRSE